MSKIHWNDHELSLIARQMIHAGFTPTSRSLGPGILAAQRIVLGVERQRPVGSINSSSTLAQVRVAIDLELMRLKVQALTPPAERATDASPVSPPVVVKRGPGRPRKHAVACAPATEAAPPPIAAQTLAPAPVAELPPVQPPVAEDPLDVAVADLGVRIGQVVAQAMVIAADRQLKLTLDDYLRQFEVVLARAQKTDWRPAKANHVVPAATQAGADKPRS
jgi:hypothetical protein